MQTYFKLPNLKTKKAAAGETVNNKFIIYTLFQCTHELLETVPKLIYFTGQPFIHSKALKCENVIKYFDLNIRLA